MTMEKRCMIMAVLFAAALAIYGAARLYSPALVLHVVEQTLIQKAPSGTDGAAIRARLNKALVGAPDSRARMERLFRISAYIEKVQTLSPQELDKLLTSEKPDAASDDQSGSR